MRIFREPLGGEVWDWWEDFLFATIMIFSFGFAFSYYRAALATEFHWKFSSGFWVFVMINLVFFIPLLLMFPIGIPGLAIYVHWWQSKTAKKVIIDALREK